MGGLYRQALVGAVTFAGTHACHGGWGHQPDALEGSGSQFQFFFSFHFFLFCGRCFITAGWVELGQAISQDAELKTNCLSHLKSFIENLTQFKAGMPKIDISSARPQGTAGEPTESWGLGLFGDCRFPSIPLSSDGSGCTICGDRLVSYSCCRSVALWRSLQG